MCSANRLSQLVGNKAKGRISKQVFQENKACQIFRKTNISYSLIRTRTCVYQGVRNIRFSENLVYFVFLKHRFEIRPFALLRTNFKIWHWRLSQIRQGKFRKHIVWFTNRKFCNEALGKKKDLKKIIKIVLGFTPNFALYISENITPFKHRLVQQCRELKRANRIYTCWS